jgi:hypothetical protein
VAPSFLNRTEVITENPAPTNLRLRPIYIEPTADTLVGESRVLCAHTPTDVLAAILISEFPSLTNAPSLLRSMNAAWSFKQGTTSENVATLLERVQSADPGSLDMDEDDMGIGWGHYQFTAGGLSPESLLTSWQDVGSVATSFKLVAAAIKTCQEARLMCMNAGTPKTAGFISDVYLEKVLECLENCWVGAGGVSHYIFSFEFR